MVSKMLNKRTPTKSLKSSLRRRHLHRTPTKSPSSVLISTINHSLFSCRHRLSKLFSHLLRLSSTSSTKKHPFRKLHKTTPSKPTPPRVARTLFMGLPPLLDHRKKTIFLDLDETLIHSRPGPPPAHFDFMVRPIIDGDEMEFYVLKRPGVDGFLEFLKGRFEVVIFTAGLREYASLVLDRLDRTGAINYRLYRDSCREVEGRFVKDLGRMGRDMWKVVIVDDNPNSYAFQPENAIQIRPFVDDMEDDELGKLVKFFEACDGVNDLRDAVKLFTSSSL